jgi:hypothetical protein
VSNIEEEIHEPPDAHFWQLPPPGPFFLESRLDYHRKEKESHKKEPAQEYMGCLLSVRVRLKMKHHLCSGSENSQVTI